MYNPKRLLHLVRRGERILATAFGITALWLFAWSELGPSKESRSLALAFIIMIFMASALFGVTSELWKIVLQEQITMRESDAEWQAIRDTHWPND